MLYEYKPVTKKGSDLMDPSTEFFRYNIIIRITTNVNMKMRRSQGLKIAQQFVTAVMNIMRCINKQTFIELNVS